MSNRDNNKSVTIKDIADVAGVSYATVSRALNNRRDIRVTTRDNILRIAEELGYQPNEIARSLVNKSSSTIALIVPDITYSFFSEIALAAEDEAANNGYSMFLGNSRWNERDEGRLIKSLVQQRVDGILLHPVGDEVHFSRQINTPTVWIGLSGPSNMSSVKVDNCSGGKIGTEHLISMGYKRIACLSGSSDLDIYKERISGYIDALSNSSVLINEPLIYTDLEKREDAYKCAVSCLSEKNAPDAFFCGNDLIALGVWSAVNELGLCVSDDIGICGFDNSTAARLEQIQLTSIAQPLQMIGEKAAKLLFGQIKKTNFEPVHCVLPVELIVRKTCLGPTNL